MGETAHRGFYAAQNYRYVGPQTLQYLGVDYSGVLGTAVVTAIGTVGIL